MPCFRETHMISSSNSGIRNANGIHFGATCFDPREKNPMQGESPSSDVWSLWTLAHVRIHVVGELLAYSVAAICKDCLLQVYIMDHFKPFHITTARRIIESRQSRETISLDECGPIIDPLYFWVKPVQKVYNLWTCINKSDLVISCGV